MAADVESEPMSVADAQNVKTEDYRNGDALTNGDHTLVNGFHANGIITTPIDEQRNKSNAIQNLVGQLPPEIEHITFGYTPLSGLVSRLVQETFNGLGDVINDMSGTTVSPLNQNAPLNHFNHQVHNNGDTSQSNVQKKLRMLNFASDRRAQFIKILVLARWARRAVEVSQVIDLNVWTHAREQEYRDCIGWMGELKRRLGPLRDPNPDIKTAVEVLSLGKASWLPELGYIPPSPLTPKELLRALRRINTLLSIRLNLHEAIPPVFKDFLIASGRATFRVPDEFEVDLSIAEEDLSSQLYFIDFRFTFSPMPTELPPGRLRDQVEGRANDVLKREGLRGLFDFLHNLVLTHKLSVLKSQAQDMAKGYWSGFLTVEAVHRSLVVQYWSKKLGGKHWIEIGVKRGKEIDLAYSSNTQRIPQIALRWFRSGKEIGDVQIALNMSSLSLANIMRQVIALHTSYIFQETAAKLREAALYSEGSLRLRCLTSTTEPTDAALFVQLTALKAIKLIQEPVSGRIAVLPASWSNSQTEHRLNQLLNPAVEGASHIANLKFSVSQEEVETAVISMGWESVRSLNPSQEVVQKIFGKSTQRPRFFQKKTWASNWLLTFTTSLEGDFWWIVEIQSQETSQDTISKSIHGSAIKAAYKVTPPGPYLLVMDLSSSTLSKIEGTAAGMVSHLMDSRYLLKHKMPYTIHQAVAKHPKRGQGSFLIRYPKQRTPALIRSPDMPTFPWAHEVIKLDYHGLESSGTYAVYAASVHLSKTLANIRDLVSEIGSMIFRYFVNPDTGVETETLSFQILTKIGETAIPRLTSRLSAIGLLLDCVSAIKSSNGKIDKVSFNQINFTYKGSPDPLSAAIRFPTSAPITMSLSQPNPHLRILDQLTNLLRSEGITAVLSSLRTTDLLLTTLVNLEGAHTDGGIEVLTRSEDWYKVRYSAPYAQGGFDIHLRQRRDDLKWFVPGHSIKKGDTGNDGFQNGLKALMRVKQDGWFSTNGGMIADVQSVGDMIAKLDGAWRMSKSSKCEVGESDPGTRKAEEVVEID
ncbi:mediator of RNA polymerase II transcription subunit 14, partial [Lecanoromycetidae sp. Uapishka_2]